MDGQDEIVRAEALSNPLVLQNIFKFLPTNFLLSSCSLVSKLWNSEARSFIRDNRKCTIATRRIEETFCQFVQHLDEHCGQISAEGRVVPYNRFVINFTSTVDHYCAEKHGTTEVNEDRTVHLTSQLKLLYFDVDCRYHWVHCKVHQPLVALLRDKGHQLKSLTIGSFATLGSRTLSSIDWHPQFTRLTEISISTAGSGSLHSMLDSAAFFREMLDCAPRLKLVRAKELEVLWAVPERKYKLLHEFEIRVDHRQNVQLYKQICEAKPKLTALSISIPYCLTDVERANRDAPADRNEKLRFEATLEKVLETFHQDLETVSVTMGAYHFTHLSFSPLVNLSKLTMNSYSSFTRFQEFFGTDAPVDYARIMPNLKELEFIISSMEGWPGNNRTVLHTWSPTVHKLTLHINSGKPNLRFFQSAFPNISSLKIDDYQYYKLGDAMPISEISELWPELEELEITARRQVFRDSCDSEFCGIHPAEAKRLRRKKTEYVKTTDVVPIRHSLLSMTGESRSEFNQLRYYNIDLSQLTINCTFWVADLRKLRLNLEFILLGESGELHVPARDRNYISKVTEILAFQKMPKTDISVSWTMPDPHNQWERLKFSLIRSAVPLV